MGRFAFFEGKVVPLEEARVSVMTHSFNYGTACFEGIRAYWDAEQSQLFVFRMREHYERMLNSCKILLIRPAYTADELCDITMDILRRNGDRQDMYIRPLFYKSSKEIGVKLSGVDDEFTLFAAPMGDYLDLRKGLRVRTSSWSHVNDNSIPIRAKVVGAYVNAALAKSEALDDGYDEALLLTKDGHVSEGSAANIFIVRGGQAITPPVSEDILEGVTRHTVIKLLTERMGVQVVERPIDRTELFVAEEAFFVGTGAQVSPITEVDRRAVGTGNVGPIAKELQDLYFYTVKGRIEAYRSWCTPVFD